MRDVKVAIGTYLGPYEIVAAIGAGGMGEVFKARDTRLDRSVAIKVLPAELAQDAQLRPRFEREAKLISQLNHPNICTLHDVGDGYLVMELLEGESLADRLLRGSLPLRDVIRYGTEVAEALAQAHRAGIIHRDLKPSNVMITKSGAKLLDFGLAKASVIDVDIVAATEQKPLTKEGTILGTFQYMAPEQLEGRDADARTDIFALGALLYEMATGHRAFEGKTKTSLIAAIVKDQPRPMAELQPLAPPALQHVIDKCLEKEPDERWQSAHDVASELKWISSPSSPQGAVAEAIVSARKTRRPVVLVAAALGWAAAIAAAIITVTYAARWRAATRTVQTDLVAPVGNIGEAPLAVSPDGRFVAIASANDLAASPNSGGRGGNLKIGIRDLATGTWRTVAGTDGASFPFWSPDGRMLGFFAAGKLKTVQLESGAVRILCDAPFGRGAAWNAEGVILFAPNISAPLMKVSENGGTPVVVTSATYHDGITHRNPLFLPDGRHFLYCLGQSANLTGAGELWAGSIDGSLNRRVLDYASNVAVIDGWLLSSRDRNLIAQGFDARSCQVEGKPIAIAQNVEWYAPRYLATFAAGAETLIYQHAAQPKVQLLRLDASDNRPVPVGDTAFLSMPAASPDGQRVIVNRFDPASFGSDLWLYDLGGRAPVRLTFDNRGAMEETAAFSPDGQRIALTSPAPDGQSRIWIQPAGGGSQEALPHDGGGIEIGDWSPDGKTLLLAPQRQKTGYDITVVHLDGDRKPVPFIVSAANERSARFSPDGKWVAYESDESGRSEIYVTSFPAAASKWQVSTAGGARPSWDRDGRRLYWLAGDRIVSAAVHTDPSFSVDAPQPVDAMGTSAATRSFTVARNGRIIALSQTDAGQAPLTVVTHWQRLLK